MLQSGLWRGSRWGGTKAPGTESWRRRVLTVSYENPTGNCAAAEGRGGRTARHIGTLAGHAGAAAEWPLWGAQEQARGPGPWLSFLPHCRPPLPSRTRPVSRPLTTDMASVTRKPSPGRLRPSQIGPCASTTGVGRIADDFAGDTPRPGPFFGYSNCCLSLKGQKSFFISCMRSFSLIDGGHGASPHPRSCTNLQAKAILANC